MRTCRVAFGGWVALFGLLGSASAQTSYPMITHTSPVALQRGKTTAVTVAGQMNFFGVYKALFEGPGLSAEGLPAALGTAPKATVREVKFKVKVDENAALGVRDFRLASPLGISSVGQLLIVDHPVIQESGANNTPEKANVVKAPCVVCGRIEIAEDVDYFKFHAEAGQTFNFEVHCARLQDRIHDLQKHADPMLTLYDASGRELAANDDFFFADPYLSYTFSKAGDYLVQVRDSKYDGDPPWVYALTITPTPYVSHVFPMAGNPGATVKVEPVGSASLLEKTVALTVPKDEGLHTLALDVKGQKTNTTAFLSSSLPQVIEQEPNDTPAKAMRVTLPCGINGRIGAPRDLDHFVFKATKGKAIRFEVKARRFGTPLQSSLDSVLDIMTPAGKVLLSNDDAAGKDAALVFTPPADGDYVVRLRDLNSQGGETAVYYLEADWAVPDFSLRCDPDKAMIGPGTSTAWYVQVTRLNGFTGPVKVEVKGLPEGVSVNPLTIPASMTQGVLVLTAGANAARDAVNVMIVGTGTVKDGGKERVLVRRATPNQEIYFPGGGRGLFDVGLQSVCVTDASDILKVEVTPQKVHLKPGQEVRLDVTIHRRDDYNKGVSLDILLQHLGRVFANPLPPGVTVVAGKSKTLLGTGSKGHLVLKAAPNAAPVEDVPICVLAHVSINFVVKVSYSSPPLLLSVGTSPKR
ncbi:MAG: PPC domain-containing protein [Planctomycetes bacterium]|nr:PPC domain-containing protein [Planctomycetota bacterium]